MITEEGFEAVGVKRPYRRVSTAEMERQFEAIKASRQTDDILVLLLMRYELRHRRLLRMYGTRPTAAGQLYERIDYRLEQLRREGFVWPNAAAPGGDGSLDGNWNEDSPLSRLGYSVAKDGPGEEQRRAILRRVFTGPIPVRTKEEREIWGAPNSAQRLHKLAHHIAAICRNAKRQKAPPERAIRRWEADLDWLKKTFYDGTSFSFDWPYA